MPWMAIGSMSIWPMVNRGFRLAQGFWQTIWMRRRTARRPRADGEGECRSSTLTSPVTGLAICSPPKRRAPSTWSEAVAAG
jgi:hypothetical protein